MSDLRTPLWLLASVLGAILTASACGGGSSQTLPTIAPTTAAPAPTTTVVAVPTTEAVLVDTVPATTGTRTIDSSNNRLVHIW